MVVALRDTAVTGTTADGGAPPTNRETSLATLRKCAQRSADAITGGIAAGNLETVYRALTAWLGDLNGYTDGSEASPSGVPAEALIQDILDLCRGNPAKAHRDFATYCDATRVDGVTASVRTIVVTAFYSPAIDVHLTNAPVFTLFGAAAVGPPEAGEIVRMGEDPLFRASVPEATTVAEVRDRAVAVAGVGGSGLWIPQLMRQHPPVLADHWPIGSLADHNDAVMLRLKKSSDSQP